MAEILFRALYYPIRKRNMGSIGNIESHVSAVGTTLAVSRGTSWGRSEQALFSLVYVTAQARYSRLLNLFSK